jgi:hypothetical protein
MIEPAKEKELVDALGLIHRRVNNLADDEARSALVNGWAAQGNLIALKQKLIEEADKILDQLMKPDA